METKHEWRKKEKQYYLPNSKPEIVDIEEFKFIQLSGEGNPNSVEFSEAIRVLYSLAYAIKMMPRNGIDIYGYYDYVVYPLEGLWGLKEEARGKEVLDKDKLVYILMIRQPDFVTDEVFAKAMEIVKKKKLHNLLDSVSFGITEEGKCVQMMHIGSFDEEDKTFEVMKKFCNDNNIEIRSMIHREIYISNFRKTAKEKLKTVLRYMVK